jgi:hypothetical protein
VTASRPFGCHAAGSWSHHGPRLHQAPFSSRTVGFPESGWRRQPVSPRNLPETSEAKALVCIHPESFRLYPRLDILPGHTSFRHCVRLCFPPMPTAYREPLCTTAALPLPSCALGTGQRELPRLHRSYWLMRQTTILPSASVSFVLRVFAGCYESLLHSGPSRRYLRNPCIGAWTPAPACPSGAYPFLPGGLRPHLRSNRIGAHNKPLQCNFNSDRFSGLQSFSNVQAPILA